MREKTGVIGVIGAGTMGRGIALVALQSGHEVQLFDVDSAVLALAETEIAERLKRQAEKAGADSSAGVHECLACLHTTTDLNVMAACACVIEAVPERLKLKQELFRQLDRICSQETILATNTSSLSVTAIGAGTDRPDRVIGMHFFNPAPLMKLVEVVVGEDTADATVQAALALMRAFGKQSIVCRDTPGFIVNRVARNYYGEALRVVGEGSGSYGLVDTLLKRGGGFRMGPFRLMDLIGIDVNLDVTQSVYNAFGDEPRYRPHLLQRRMVEAGRLGRKTGRGFYRYDESDNMTEEMECSEVKPCSTEAFDLQGAVVLGDTPLAAAIRQHIATRTSQGNADCGLIFERVLPYWDQVATTWRIEEVGAFLRRRRPNAVIVSTSADHETQRELMQAVERYVARDVLILTSLHGGSATEQASWLAQPGRLRGLGGIWPIQDADGWTVEVSTPLQVVSAEPTAGAPAAVDARMASLCQSLGWNMQPVQDGVGGVQMRILSMVLNEAAEVVREGIASPEDVDLAMRLGANWPMGPCQWMDAIGIPSVLQTLTALQREYGDDRYRPSPLLKHMMLAGLHGESTGRGWYTYPEVKR